MNNRNRILAVRFRICSLSHYLLVRSRSTVECKADANGYSDTASDSSYSLALDDVLTFRVRSDPVLA